MPFRGRWPRSRTAIELPFAFKDSIIDKRSIGDVSERGANHGRRIIRNRRVRVRATRAPRTTGEIGGLDIQM